MADQFFYAEYTAFYLIINENYEDSAVLLYASQLHREVDMILLSSHFDFFPS
jgi:hypothetical protein